MQHLAAATAMDEATLEKLVELSARATELHKRGHYERAAEKLEAAVALAERTAPHDCLILVRLRHDMLQVRGLPCTDEPSRLFAPLAPSVLAAQFDPMSSRLPPLCDVLERRRLANTLMPGRCLPAEEKWYEMLVMRNNNTSRSNFRELAAQEGPLVGYETYVEIAGIVTFMLTAKMLDQGSSSIDLHSVEFVEHAVAMLVSLPSHRMLSAGESALIKALELMPDLVRHETDVKRRLQAAWLAITQSGIESVQLHGALNFDSTRPVEAFFAARAKATEAGLLKFCALAGCGAKEAHVSQFSRCSACKAAVYCCKEHQVAAWPDHKKACKAARKAAEEAAARGATKQNK